TNPLRALLLHETDNEERNEITRLDLSNALGHWTTFRQLERDLLVRNPGTVSKWLPSHDGDKMKSMLESWDAESDSDDTLRRSTLYTNPKTLPNFVNLRHLSL